MAGSYVRRKAIIALAVNVVLNPVVIWVSHQGTEFVPVGSMIRDVAVISVLLALIVSALGHRSVRRYRKAGHPMPSAQLASERHLLSRLPTKAWQLGLLLGVVLGLTGSLVLGVLSLFGFTGLSVADFATFQALFSGVGAFIVMRWTILSQAMAPAGVSPVEAAR